jgi:hypothetical protein
VELEAAVGEPEKAMVTSGTRMKMMAGESQDGGGGMKKMTHLALILILDDFIKAGVMMELRRTSLSGRGTIQVKKVVHLTRVEPSTKKIGTVRSLMLLNRLVEILREIEKRRVNPSHMDLKMAEYKNVPPKEAIQKMLFLHLFWRKNLKIRRMKG